MEIDSSLVQLIVMLLLSAAYYFIKKPKKDNPPAEGEHESYEDYDTDYSDEEAYAPIENMEPILVEKNDNLSKNYKNPFLNIEIDNNIQPNKYAQNFQKLEEINDVYSIDYKDNNNESEDEFYFDAEQAVIFSEILKRPYS